MTGDVHKRYEKDKMNMEMLLQETTRRYPENTAVIYEGKRISYAELNQFVEALAHYLQGLGIRKGDKVAIMLANCPEFIISYFGIQKIGGVAVTLNTQSTPYELKHLLGDSDSKCMITQGAMA